MNDSTTRPRPRPRSGLTLALTLLAFAHFIISVDFNIVYVALPEIGRDLGFTAQSLQWVVSAYAVGLGGFLLLGGRAVDRLGRRRMFVLGLALFGLASLAGGVAAGPGMLVAARAAQGLGAALLFPATLSLINTRFAAGPERNRALALWGAAGASGALFGPMAGGVLTSGLSWEWVFYVNVPLTLVAAVAARRLLAADAPRAGRDQGRGQGSFDVPGALVATAGSTLLVFGLVSGPEAGWLSVRAAGSLIAGAAVMGAFVLIERRTRDPLVPLRLLRIRSLVVAMVLIFVFMGTVNTLHYLFVVHMQSVLGYSALEAGLGFLPQSVVAIAGSWLLLPVLLNRWGVRATLLTWVAAAGVAMIAMAAGMTAGGSYWPLLPGVALFGLGAGMAYPAILAAATSGVASGEQGVASALTATSQQIGGAMGLAALVAVANANLDLNAAAAPAVADVAAGLRTAGLVAGVVTITGAFITLALTRREPRPEADAEPAAPPGATPATGGTRPPRAEPGPRPGR